jgi:hypothetical protein
VRTTVLLSSKSLQAVNAMATKWTNRSKLNIIEPYIGHIGIKWNI